jgi:hypothetical protein
VPVSKRSAVQLPHQVSRLFSSRFTSAVHHRPILSSCTTHPSPPSCLSPDLLGVRFMVIKKLIAQKTTQGTSTRRPLDLTGSLLSPVAQQPLPPYTTLRECQHGLYLRVKTMDGGRTWSSPGTLTPIVSDSVPPRGVSDVFMTDQLKEYQSILKATVRCIRCRSCRRPF